MSQDLGVTSLGLLGVIEQLILVAGSIKKVTINLNYTINNNFSKKKSIFSKG